ncbi:MAG: Mov34/MPN/PAD-1 family protein [Acidimicrobiales bacterium]
MLRLPQSVWLAMVAHCLAGLPEEACGLLAGAPNRDPASDPASDGASNGASDGVVARCYPTANAAHSARVYVVEPRDHLRADRDAESRGLEVMGVFHSHTHTDAYPSPTDVAQAPDPDWHYVLVSLRHEVTVVRSYRIVDGKIDEEQVVLEGG